MTTNNIIAADAISAAGAIAIALLGLAFLFQKVLAGFKSTSIESDVMTKMHNELERMGEHNTTLMAELGKLQRETIRLNEELYKLTSENQNLHREVVRLTYEISRLKHLIPGAMDEQPN